MIINHERRFVFVCVPKTGSTTLSKYFKRTGEFDKPKDHPWLTEKYHYPISRIQTEEDVKGYYKFAYHRNPYDRLVSSWIDFTQWKGHQSWSRGQAVDHVARYEHFSSETQQILNHLGIKYRDGDLGQLRFRQSNRDKDYRNYYKDDATIEIVSKHFESDIKTFGDKF